VPLVLLLTAAVTATPRSRALGAYLLVNCLLKLFIVDNGSHFAIAVGGPERCLYFCAASTGIFLGLILGRQIWYFCLSLEPFKLSFVINTSIVRSFDPCKISEIICGWMTCILCRYVGMVYWVCLRDHMVNQLHWVGCVSPWLLAFPKHPPQEGLVVVNEGVDLGVWEGGASGGTGQLVQSENTGKPPQNVTISIVHVHAL